MEENIKSLSTQKHSLMKNLLMFLPVWIMTGFILGTETTIGPIRWIAMLCRILKWNTVNEHIFILFNALFFILFTFFFSILLVRTIQRSHRIHVKIGIPILLILFVLGSLYLRFNNEVPDPIKVSPQPDMQIIVPLSQFLTRRYFDIKTFFLFSPFFLLYIGLVGYFVGQLQSIKRIRVPYTRKIFHFLIFSMAAILQLIAGLKSVILFGVLVSLTVLYAVLRGNGFPFYEALARPGDEPHRTLFILIPLAATALGGFLSNLFFPQYAIIGYLVTGWGDATGEPIGTMWGKHQYHVLSFAGIKVKRSLEGSFAVFLTGSIAALVGFYFMGMTFHQAFFLALLCGMIGTIVEAISSHGLDNLTIQMAVSATAYFMLR